MKTLELTPEQLDIIRAVVSHACANKYDAQDELDISLEGIEELEKLLYAGEQGELL